MEASAEQDSCLFFETYKDELFYAEAVQCWCAHLSNAFWETVRLHQIKKGVKEVSTTNG